MKQRLSAALGAAALLAAPAALGQLAVGSPAPEFTLRDTEGKTVSLSQYRGKRYVLLDFWTSSSAHCLNAMPELRALQEKYRPQLAVLGVNADEAPAQGTATAKQLQLNFPVLLRGDQVMEEYGAAAFPATYLIDPARKIAEAQVGANSELWPRVETIVARFQPPAEEEREGTGGPRKAAQITHQLAFPQPPGPREFVVGQEVKIRFNRPEGLQADLVALAVDGKPLAVFGPASSYTWDATKASNGPHTLRIAAQTASGRETWAVQQTVIVDNRPPVNPESASPRATAKAGNRPPARPVKTARPKRAPKRR